MQRDQQSIQNRTMLISLSLSFHRYVNYLSENDISFIHLIKIMKVVLLRKLYRYLHFKFIILSLQRF